MTLETWAIAVGAAALVYGAVKAIGMLLVWYAIRHDLI